jgi:2,4-diaminopentanoate dehydrogenase
VSARPHEARADHGALGGGGLGGVRAIVYGVGAMGSIIARLMLEKGATIVGAIARSPEKVGRDLGEVAGLGRETGVIVDDDPARVLGTCKADIAVVAVASYLEVMQEHFRLCLEHGVNVLTIEEESFFPWGTAPGPAAELDAIAKRHGLTITGSGAQDAYWMNMVSLLMGAAHRIDAVIGRTTWNVNDYGPEVARHVRVGDTAEEFERLLQQEGWPSFVVRNTLDALAADVGLTTVGADASVRPVVADSPRPCRSLAVTIPAGRLLGVVDSVTLRTAEGPTLTFEMAGYVYDEDETDSNEWLVRGDPEELHLRNERVPTRLISCTQVVNRIPDVIDAEPGFVTVDRLPKLRYRLPALAELDCDLATPHPGGQLR